MESIDANVSQISRLQTLFTYDTYTVSTLICSLIMIFLCVLGVYGNVLSICIFTKPIMRRSSINILLTSLSAIDLSVLILTVFVFVLPGLNETFKFAWFQRFYTFTILILYPMVMIGQSCSIWTFVLISLERYLAVCYPLNVNKYLTPNRTKLAESGIILLSFGYNLVRFWEYEDADADDSTRLTYLLRSDPYYFKVYITGLYLMTHFLLPFIVITILHAYIARGIRSAQAERRRMTLCTESHATTARTTRMIFAVTCIFGVCNSLAFVLNIWEACRPDLFITEWSILAYIILDISNIAVLINCSTTFLIYLIYCRKYKMYFKQYHKLACLSPHTDAEQSETSMVYRSSFRTMTTKQLKNSSVYLYKRNSRKYYVVPNGENVAS